MLLEKYLFARLFNLNLQKCQESVSKKLQDNMFDGLSNSNLLEFAMGQWQDPFKVETMCLTSLSQLWTTQQAARRICDYMWNYTLSLLTLKFYD